MVKSKKTILKVCLHDFFKNFNKSQRVPLCPYLIIKMFELDGP